MPSPIDPYSPRAVWGRELRHYREAAGLTQTQLADRVHYSEALISSIETGKAMPQPDFATACDSVLATGGALTRLLDMLRTDRHPVWFREYVGREQHATTIRFYSPLVVPGLLQTEAYARAVLRAGQPWISDSEVESLVTARLERQRILTRKEPPLIIAVLDEFVVRRTIGSPAIMAEQLAHLMESARMPRTLVQVVPAETGAHAGLEGAFTISSFHGRPDVGWLEHLEGQMVHSPQQVGRITNIFDAVRADALPVGATVDLLTEATKRWTT